MVKVEKKRENIKGSEHVEQSELLNTTRWEYKFLKRYGK